MPEVTIDNAMVVLLASCKASSHPLPRLQGYTLRGLKLMNVSKQLAESHYADLSSKPFFAGALHTSGRLSSTGKSWTDSRLVCCGPTTHCTMNRANVHASPLCLGWLQFQLICLHICRPG